MSDYIKEHVHNRVSTHSKRKELLTELMPYIFCGLLKAINEDTLEKYEFSDFNKLLEYTHIKWLSKLCKTPINDHGELHFEETQVSTDGGEVGAALFVQLLSQLVKSSINNTDNNELSQNHINCLATSVASIARIFNPKWKWTYGIIVSLHIKALISSRAVLDIFGKLITGINYQWIYCRLKDYTDKVSNLDIKLIPGTITVNGFDNWGKYAGQLKSSRADTEMIYPIVTNMLTLHYKQPHDTMLIQKNIDLKPGPNCWKNDVPRHFYRPSLSDTNPNKSRSKNNPPKHPCCEDPDEDFLIEARRLYLFSMMRDHKPSSLDEDSNSDDDNEDSTMNVIDTNTTTNTITCDSCETIYPAGKIKCDRECCMYEADDYSLQKHIIKKAKPIKSIQPTAFKKQKTARSLGGRTLFGETSDKVVAFTHDDVSNRLRLVEMSIKERNDLRVVNNLQVFVDQLPIVKLNPSSSHHIKEIMQRILQSNCVRGFTEAGKTPDREWTFICSDAGAHSYQVILDIEYIDKVAFLAGTWHEEYNLQKRLMILCFLHELYSISSSSFIIQYFLSYVFENI